MRVLWEAINDDEARIWLCYCSHDSYLRGDRLWADYCAWRSGWWP